MRLAYWVGVVLLQIRDYYSNKRRDGSEESDQIKYIDSDHQSVVRNHGWLRCNGSRYAFDVRLGHVLYLYFQRRNCLSLRTQYSLMRLVLYPADLIAS